MAMQKPTVADVKKAIAPAVAVANAVIAAPAFAEGTGEVDPTLISFDSVREPWRACTLPGCAEARSTEALVP
jgi:hypothetical protein